MMTPFVDVLFYIFDDDIGFAILCFIDTLASKKARKKKICKVSPCIIFIANVSIVGKM